MNQYYEIKAVHHDAILLFRVGDFYETFGEDAIKASGILGITLTRRANGAASYVELAGFPYHAIDSYLPKLVRAGERVAICEQLEDPKQAKGLVKRDVIRVITPGTLIEGGMLEDAKNKKKIDEERWGEMDELVTAPLLDPSIQVYRGDENSLIEQYYAQTQWYYALADYKGVFLARLTDNDIVIYYVEPDEDVQKALYNTAIRFHDKVESGWEPAPVNTVQAKTAHPNSEENSEISADSDIRGKMERLAEIRTEKKDLEAEEEIIKTEVMDYMKEKEVLLSADGEKLATWKTVRRSTFDSTRFKQDYPHLYEVYQTKSETRPFRFAM